MDGLSDEDRADPGTWQRWSAKDNVAHVTYYIDLATERLEAELRGEAVPPAGDEHEVNDAIYQKHQQDTWEQVRVFSENTFTRVIALIQSLTDDQLTRKDVFTSLRLSAGGRFISNTLVHPAEHFTTYFIQHDNLEKAFALQEQVGKELKKAGDLFPYGYTIYNLACMYAKANMAEKALELLPEALTLQPDLKDWSKQDPDLVSLRDLAAFQALVN
jgi:hypothetical protein